MHNKSVRAGLVIDSAQQFFRQYLFVTESNYSHFVKEVEKEAKLKSADLDSGIARLKIQVSNKEKTYEQTKDLIRKNPELKEHYDLGKYSKEVEDLKAKYKRSVKQRDKIKSAIPTFEEYLKLLQSTPVILGKIRDMKMMDVVLRVFFSNFTITPVADGTFKGS